MPSCTLPQAGSTWNLRNQGQFVVLKVTNQGAPIPTDMLESIFDPLVRHEQHASSELSSGLGLGLFIVREIAKAHGGTIQVSSSASEGTTFSVRLPRSWALIRGRETGGHHRLSLVPSRSSGLKGPADL
jgi:signal transduction histidine kinase